MCSSASDACAGSEVSAFQQQAHGALAGGTVAAKSKLGPGDSFIARSGSNSADGHQFLGAANGLANGFEAIWMR